MSILIVEPDESYRTLLSTLIGGSGSEPVCVSSIAEAERFLHSGTISAMVTEWRLPEGSALGLIEWASRARSAGRPVACVVLTRSASRDEVLAAIQAGVSGFVLKGALDARRMQALLGFLGLRAATDAVQPDEPSAVPLAAPSEAGMGGAPATSAGGEPPASLKDIRPLVTRASVLDRLREITEVKAMSPTVTQVTQLTSNPTVSLDAIAKVISHDQSVALKVLSLANSSLYERGAPVTSVRDAVLRIGTKNIRDLVLNLELMDAFSETVTSHRLNFMHFWEHSIACGMIAAALGRVTGHLDADRAFTLGLLHDVGRMVLAEHFSEEYAQVLEVADRLQLPLERVESRMLLMNHADIMDRLLLMWHFPRDLVLPLSSHHLSAANLREHAKRQLGESAVLALADRLTHAAMIGSSGNATIYPTLALAELLGLKPGQLGPLVEQAEREASDIKFSLLMVGKSQPWTPLRDKYREQLARPLNPLVVPAAPGLDALEITLDRLRSEGVPLNVSVVHLASPADSVPAASRLVTLEEGAGGIRPPLLVLSPSGDLTLPGNIGEGRPVELLPMPVTLPRLLGTLDRLTAQCAGARSVEHRAA